MMLPRKGWEEVDTLYQNHHKAPKLVYPGGGWVWTKRFSVGKFVFQTIFLWRKWSQKLICTSESVSIVRPKNIAIEIIISVKKCVCWDTLFFQTLHPTLAQFLQRTPCQHPGPPFFLRREIWTPQKPCWTKHKFTSEVGVSKWWQLKDERRWQESNEKTTDDLLSIYIYRGWNIIQKDFFINFDKPLIY